MATGSEVPQERAPVSLPEQLKSAYAKGTSASKSLKEFSKKAKLVSYWVVGVLLLVGMILLFIPHLGEEYTKQQEAEAKLGATAQPRAPVQQSDNWYGKKHTITVTRETLMKPVMVEGGRCIRWWEKDPEGDTYTAYVRDVNDQTWYKHQEYRKKFPGRGFGWIRFEPNKGQEEAIVFYAFYRLGECG